MKFPSVGDIATTSVITIDIKDSASNAIDKMLKHEHRHVVVVDGYKYFIISVVDILHLQEKNIALETSLNELKLKKIPVINKNKNILDSLEFLNGSAEYICVLNNDESLYGLLTHTDITNNIDPDTLMENYRLQDFLKIGRRMKWVSKEEKVSDIVSDMLDSAYDNVIVVDNLKPIGILTTKDIMLLIKNKVDLHVEVQAHMSTPVDTINKTVTIKDALNFIKQKHYKRAVVVDDNGNLSGVISQKELISLTYSNWVVLMKEYQDELSEINALLKNQNKEYEKIASTDTLTGLYNRYKFSELFMSSFVSMSQRDNDMSLIILDVDNFKQVNDTYGHNIGDKTLVQISHALLKTLRNIDIVCRWGGEEFVVLLPTASLDNAVYLAEKIRVYIEQLDIDVVKHVTASFGVAQVLQTDEMQDVISRADKALYLAKESGKNCVKTQEDMLD